MRLGETDITVVFGQRGSGKSSLGRALSSIYPRRIVIDRLREWTGQAATARGYKEFLALYQSVQRLPSFTIAVQFDLGLDPALLSEQVNQMLRAIYLTEHADPQGLCIVIEEVHFFAAPTSIEPWLLEVVTTGRHAGLALVVNSQRPAQVHKSLVSLASNVMMGRLFEARDLKYLQESVGGIALQCRDLANFQFIHYRPGEGSQLITS